jgi:hypothetical protein
MAAIRRSRELCAGPLVCLEVMASGQLSVGHYFEQHGRQHRIRGTGASCPRLDTAL